MHCAEAERLLDSRKLNSEELVSACLERIARLDAKVNAFITVLSKESLEEARLLDRERRAGKKRGPLHGIPIAVKDNIDVAGVQTTAGSAVFRDVLPTTDAEVVARLRHAGAIIVGKTNMQEFGLGSSSVDSHYGPVRNPWDLSRYAGGSSGGSAVAVSMDFACAAIGTDTGGSVRTPAAYCGVVGFKARYGAISLDGIVPAKSSLDHCGPLTHTVADASLLFQVMSGEQLLLPPTKILRVGIPHTPFFADLDAGVGEAVAGAIASLQSMTAEIGEVTLPETGHISMAGETYAFHQPYFEKDPNLYTPHARRAIHKDSQAQLADYIRARSRLEALRKSIHQTFENFDVVVLPTRKKMPETIAEYLERDLLDSPIVENTGPFNLFGIPAISLPCGFTPAGLPVGLTIAGPAESAVLALAQAYEQAHNWRQMSPPLR